MSAGDRPTSPPDGITASAPGGAATAAPAAPEKKKSLWETILVSTPIIMTVVATLLAGMSSSQMTQAMYHRAVAAQEESKGGNQWSFFQAKRIRGTSLEMTLVELRARPTARRVKLADLPKLLHDQVADYRRIESEAGAVAELLRKAQPERKAGAEDAAAQRDLVLALVGAPPAPEVKKPAGDRTPLAVALADAEALRKLAYDKANETEQAAANLKEALTKPLDGKQKEVFATDLGHGKQLKLDTRADLVRLVDSGKVPRIKKEDGINNDKGDPQTDPQVALTPALNDINPQIQVVLDAVRDRKSDHDLLELVKDKAGRPAHPVTHEQIKKALEEAEQRAASFDNVDGTIKQAGSGGFDTAADEQEARAVEVAVAAARLKRSLAVLPAESMPVAGIDLTVSKDLGKARNTADVLATQAEQLKDAAHEIYVGVRTTLLDYDARRYRQESRYNQATASLRELQARMSAFESDDHLAKSKLFFYGMLAAQAGVTIATMALAVRMKGILWGLATTTGLLAVSFGAYVLLMA